MGHCLVIMDDDFPRIWAIVSRHVVFVNVVYPHSHPSALLRLIVPCYQTLLYLFTYTDGGYLVHYFTCFFHDRLGRRPVPGEDVPGQHSHGLWLC